MRLLFSPFCVKPESPLQNRGGIKWKSSASLNEVIAGVNVEVTETNLDKMFQEKLQHFNAK